MNTCICILSHNPNEKIYKFMNNFSYKVFILIDNNKINLQNYITKYKNLTFIQINENDCLKKNYFGCLNEYSNKFNKVLSWDKGLYYFSFIKTCYDYVWLIEDDVLFTSEYLITYLNNSKEDILCSSTAKYSKDNIWIGCPDGIVRDLWNLNSVNNQFDKSELYKSLVQILRLSKKSFEVIKEHVNINKQLCFIECIFASLIYKYNLSHKNIYDNVILKNTLKYDEIHYYKFNHAVKDKSIFNILNNLPNYKNFDSFYYYLNNTDLQTYYNHDKLLNHFNNYGIIENRITNINFDYFNYKLNNYDIKDLSNDDLWRHWCIYGKYENRKIS